MSGELVVDIDDFNSLLLNHGLSKDSAITLEVLYNVVGEQFVKDTEGMVSQSDL